MSRNARRTLITFVVVLVAFGAVLAVMKGQGKTKPLLSAPPSNPPAAAGSQSVPAAASNGTANLPAATAPATTQTAASLPSLPAVSTQPSLALTAVAPGTDLGARTSPPQTLGSLDPREQSMQLVFTRNGAGIAAINFSNIWENAEAKRQAEAYFKSLAAGDPIDFSRLDAANRFLLQSTLPYYWSGKTFNIPVIAAHSVVVNGTSVNLLSESAWSETAPGMFQTRIVDASGTPLLEITRQFIIERNFDIALKQSVRNLTDSQLQVKWQQYGPVELNVDKSGYIDRRRFEFGYLPRPVTNPDIVLADDSSLRLERSDVIKAYVRSLDPNANQLQERRLWPNKTSVAQGYGLSWFASNSRYFGLAIHPLVDGQGNGNRSLSGVVEEVRLDVSGHGGPDERVFTFLVSPLVTIGPGGESTFNMGVYAGPLDREILKTEPYSSLAMRGLIVYQMSSCCSFLTFQWLAKFLLGFLSLLHDYVVFDWGLAIIGLVMVVRTLLHPLTRKSQISMQRFGKQMSAMKPEIDKLQKKYPNDPKRVQQEQMVLMREHGVNPLQMLGCLPLFLQTPIWIALWAMLYLAFDIRQQPAFYGVFQHFGWAFLGDLSSQDYFWRLSGNGFTIPLINAHITSINLLPLLMGLVFFLQQKYLTPPPTPNMTAEQIQQQRIMKWMTVVMMPMFLYKAPCGLTLYMVTSSCIGIMESRYIRKHISELELNPPPKKESRLAKLRDPLARAYAKRMEEAKRGKDEPPKSFKKRK